ncbi:MAG TPA: multiprotein-bridging factor 1 family protein [Candidatus Nanoarchaeia archaeon]|nr:multiprotein-bridging factor 1 family protein [Candidatus Nanoarchaeia archaeon]
MVECEMCGSPSILKAKVEGVGLNVCKSCSKYGEIEISYHPPLSKNYLKEEEPPMKLIDSFSKVLIKIRQNLGLTQEEFAKSLNERESIIAKWEKGNITPDLRTVRKLEKIIGTKLLEKDKTDSEINNSGSSSDELTLGDFIRVRKRQQSYTPEVTPPLAVNKFP